MGRGARQDDQATAAISRHELRARLHPRGADKRPGWIDTTAPSAPAQAPPTVPDGGPDLSPDARLQRAVPPEQARRLLGEFIIGWCQWRDQATLDQRADAPDAVELSDRIGEHVWPVVTGRLNLRADELARLAQISAGPARHTWLKDASWRWRSIQNGWIERREGVNETLHPEDLGSELLDQLAREARQGIASGLAGDVQDSIGSLRGVLGARYEQVRDRWLERNQVGSAAGRRMWPDRLMSQYEHPVMWTDFFIDAMAPDADPADVMEKIFETMVPQRG